MPSTRPSDLYPYFQYQDYDQQAVPQGFIELHCVPTGRPWHVRCDSIASYGPDMVGGDIQQFAGCPVILIGWSKADAVIVSLHECDVAKLIIRTEYSKSK
jgi:hypothetical protein